MSSLKFETGPSALTGFPSGPYVVTTLPELFKGTNPLKGCLEAAQCAGDNNPFGVAVTIDGHRCFIWEAGTRKAKITCIRGELISDGKPIGLDRDRLVILAPLSLATKLQGRHNHIGQQIYAPGWPGKGVLEMSCVEGDLFITGEIGVEVKTSAE